MTRRIPQMEPVFTPDDIRAVCDYMSSGGWVTEFERTRELESAIAGYTGASRCTIAPNGTLALFLALRAAGVGPGDDVIVPDLTMAATATAVSLAGANVVFCDIEPVTLCLDLAQAAAMITERTKAVMFVSLNGRAPAGLVAFAADCRRRGIVLIEDAAQSLGSYLDGRHLGTIGDAGCFSFSSQKIVTTGQGGAIVTDDDALFGRMKLLRDFGRRSGGTDQYDTIGWNLKFTDLQAVLGLAQMRRLDALVTQKRELYRWYLEGLAGLPGLTLPVVDLQSTTPWFVDALVDGPLRADLVEHLRAHGIGTRPIYPALHAEAAFDQRGSFPVAEDVARRGLWLPSSLRLTRDDVDFVCEEIRAFFSIRGPR